MGMLPTFSGIFRERRNREPPGHVYCTLIIVSDQLMPIESIFGGRVSSDKLQNLMGYGHATTIITGRVLTPTDFHHLTNHLNQLRMKLYCSEISSKLFPDYHDRRTTKRTCSNVYIHSDFSTDIDLIDLFEGLTRESEAWQKIIGRLVERKQVRKVLIKLMIAGLAAPQLQCSHAVRQTVAVRNQGAIARCYIQSSISNLRKPVFNATCAMSVFYANWAV
ncbi:hypothetical protein T01_9223 [Trichinella spiralis]|uniref:Uncharacterized protein n=1 Tax=Trichinella spiralis TaxID=6334 RepID=A0A0V1BSE8_TRISP|nr:hypothetical protein T01_9223 [Trichinella spiralis]